MEGMFENSRGSMDLSAWDVSKVTQMRSMFRHATGFQSLNLTGWDVRKVADMTDVFAFSYGLKNVSTWDVSSVSNMEGMFRGASQRKEKRRLRQLKEDDDDS